MPIIFITAFPDKGVQARALKAGAVAFLVKPIDGKTLLDCLDVALKRHRADPTMTSVREIVPPDRERCATD
jgi:FixJ family two-component response regulator